MGTIQVSRGSGLDTTILNWFDARLDDAKPLKYPLFVQTSKVRSLDVKSANLIATQYSLLANVCLLSGTKLKHFVLVKIQASKQVTIASSEMVRESPK